MASRVVDWGIGGGSRRRGRRCPFKDTKQDERVEEEMIRKCAVVSRVEWCPNDGVDGVDGAWIRRGLAWYG